MDEELNLLLDEEIKHELEGLAYLEQGDEVHSEAVEDINKLYKLRLEDSRTKGETRERKHKLVLGITGTVLPIATGFVMGLLTLNFEKTGSICSTAGRTFVNGVMNGLFRRK